ncbi:MAG: ribose-5-phosphate isomerase RpiA, partial [Isosphaeraceae bacterium]
MTVAERALDYIHDGHVVGLGTGRTATLFIQALAERVKAGLAVRGVASSRASADLARRLGIPLTTLDEVETIDVTVDGADEVDPRLNLIKGRGGALVREMIVAASARQFIVVVGKGKLVPTLGGRGVLPVEVVPFALGFCRRRLTEIGCQSEPRQTGDALYLTDNGNPILDCRIDAIPDPEEL